MSRSLIKLNLYRLPFAVLEAFAKTIHGGFITQIADYPGPNPVMAVFKLHIDALVAAIAAWGVKGNRGSHADFLNLRAKANIVKNDLRMLAAYAQNVQPDNIASWTAVGFAVKRERAKAPTLEQVQDFRHFISRSVPSPYIKLKWKRPLDTGKDDVNGYLVQRSNIPDYPGKDHSGNISGVVSIVVKTDFIDENPFAGANWYWITPFNSAGFGVTSKAVRVVSERIV